MQYLSQITCVDLRLRSSLISIFLINLCYLFIFGCVWSSLLHAGFLQLHRAGATLRCGARASHCSGFSCCGARALGARASVVVAHGLNSCGSQALERSLSSCGAQAQLLCGMWDLPRPGLKPVSPALAGGFLTTVPPGNSPLISIKIYSKLVCSKLMFHIVRYINSKEKLLKIVFNEDGCRKRNVFEISLNVLGKELSIYKTCLLLVLPSYFL